MKFLLDLLPLILFFAVFKLYDIYYATAALMISAFLPIIHEKISQKTVSRNKLIMLLAILGFGALTLSLQNPLFIKWKLTVVYALFAAIILIRFWWLNKNTVHDLLKHLGEANLHQVPNALWQRLNYLWALYLLVFAGLNLYIAYQFDNDTWVNFKVWGTMAGTLLVMVLTLTSLFRYFPDDNQMPSDKKED